MPPRPIYLIASEISSAWPKPYFGAVPYLQALRQIEEISDHYGADTGKYIVAGFLANAASFRGPKARELKAELNAHLEGEKNWPEKIIGY
jgi:hypothetical protein